MDKDIEGTGGRNELQPLPKAINRVVCEHLCVDHASINNHRKCRTCTQFIAKGRDGNSIASVGKGRGVSIRLSAQKMPSKCDNKGSLISSASQQLTFIEIGGENHKEEERCQMSIPTLA